MDRLFNTLKHTEHQGDEEEEAAYNINGLSQAILCHTLRFLLHVFDAGEAAIVIVIMAVQRPHVAGETERKSLRITEYVKRGRREAIGRQSSSHFAILSLAPWIPELRRQAL